MNLKFDEKKQFNGFIGESEANMKANGRNVKRTFIQKRKNLVFFKGVKPEGAWEFFSIYVTFINPDLEIAE